MKSRKFTEEEPASNIREVLTYLEKTHSSKHCYRGQTKHYGSLVPSAYRIARDAIDLQKVMIPIDSRFERRQLGTRELIRLKKLGGLIRTYGPGLGNMLAQQYGITSECLDITTDPTVAAFFATRKYPSYAHWRGSADNPLGVIYRFTAINFVSDLNGLNMTLQFVGMKVSGGPVWFFKRLRRSQLSEQEMDSILGDRDHVVTRLFTHPGVVTHDLFRSIVEQYYEEKNAEALALLRPGDKPILYTAHKQLDSTRMIRQRGGFLVPSYIEDCTVPREVDIEYIPVLKNRFFSPSYAIGERLVAVENLCQYPQLESFFFRHSGEDISEVSREYLWPGAGEDYFFRWVSEIASYGSEEYLSEHNCKVDGREYGIVDRGYYEE